MIMCVHGVRRFIVLPLFGVCFVMVLAGCGATGPDLVEVTGTVTLDGQPVDGAVVGFRPSEGTPAAATTDATGKFTLRVSVGQCAITVIKSETVGGGAVAGADETAQEVQTKSLLPIKYSAAQGSGLTADVQRGMAPLTLELTSK